MVGDGEDLPNYKQQVIDLGLADRVTFFNPMPARKAFALGRTLVVPSRAEAMPYIVLETLAAGKTMVATVGRRHSGDLRRRIRQRWSIPTPTQLAEKMQLALTDPALFASYMPSTRPH